MKIALFGNYVFAKIVAEMIINECELVCFCNDVYDDDKFGGGIQKYARDNNIKCIIGNKKRHINNLGEFMPDYILSIAYKNIIPVEDLSVEVYGIHLGGIYGSDAIRGKSSLVWYKLRNIEYAKVSLYHYTANDIDVGELIKEVKFEISLDDRINIDLQLGCVKSLVRFILEGGFRLSALGKEIVVEKMGSYYPKAISEINGVNLDKNEITQLEKVGININNKKNFTEREVSVDEKMGRIYQYCVGNCSNRNVLFLHGFASIIPNVKTKKLSGLLDGISVNVPLVKGINRIYCDGMQSYGDISLQFETLIRYFDLSETIIVCSSISSLLLCEHFPRLFDVKAIIFVTPIFNLFDNSFDEKLKEVVWNDLNEKNFEFSNPYYKGCKMSKELLEKLKEFNLLEYIRRFAGIKNKMYFILAKDDPNIEAKKWRDKCIEEGIPLNNVNIIDGTHSFADIQQLYYLACLVKKIFG